jgi:hypothetical protein
VKNPQRSLDCGLISEKGRGLNANWLGFMLFIELFC